MNDDESVHASIACPRSSAPRGAALALLALAAALAPAGCARDPGALLERARALGAAGDHAAAVELLDRLIAADEHTVPARLLRAQLALVAGEGTLAERDLRQALADGASDNEALAPLGRALLAQGAFERVTTEIPRSLPSVRQSAQLLVLHGRAHAGLGDLEEARRIFMTALRLDERCVEAWIGIARLARERRRYEEAETQGWRAIAIDPSSLGAWRERGVLEFERARYAEAEQAFERALTSAGHRYWLEEDGVLAATGLAETLWRGKRREAARARLDEIERHLPTHPVLLYLRALFALERGDHDAAGRYAQALLAKDGEYPAVFALLGLSALERDDAGGAAALLERAVALRPRDAGARELLARARLAGGDPAGAFAALLPVPAGGLLDEGFLTLLGRARLAAGDLSGGLAALVVAARTGPVARDQDPVLVPEAELVVAMYERGRGEVLARAERLLEQRPEALLGFLGLAQVAELQGAPQDALQWLRRAREAHPAAVEPLLLLARRAIASGDLAPAAAHAGEAIALAPELAEGHATLGLARLLAGDYGAARRSLRVAMLLEPRNPLRRVHYAAAQLGAGDVVRALATLAEALRMPGADLASPMAELVRAERLRGRGEQALRLARELQRMQPPRAAAWAAEGDLHLLDGRAGAADDAYTAATARESSRLLALKSFLARRAAGLSEPATPLSHWLERHPNDRRMRLVLAQACAESGQHASAMRHYERVLASDAHNRIATAALVRLQRSIDGSREAPGERC